MKKKLPIGILLSTISCVATFANNNVVLDNIIRLGLPTIVINTIDSEDPSCDYVEAPEGCMGLGRINDKKVNGSLVIISHGDTLYNSGEYVKEISGMSIRLSGNTSGYYSDIKPYRIKLEKKADLLCRDNDKCKDKEWRLLIGSNGAYNIVGFKLSELIGMTWTPQYIHCNLVLNGTYRGVYLLTESIKRNPDCRINVTKEGGYIVERDPYWWNESLSFNSSFYEKDLSYKWTFKYPDDNDITEKEIEYISQYIDKAEAALFDNSSTSSYEKHFDIMSMAKWLMLHDILGTRDSGGSNMFFSKYDDTDESLMTMPVAWDFDSAFMVNSHTFSNIHNSGHGYFRYLLAHNNQTFTDEYKKIWKYVTDENIFDDLQNYLTNFYYSDEGQAVNKSREMALKYHYTNVTSLEQDIMDAKDWLAEHYRWLDNEISLLTGNQDNIKISIMQQSNNYFNPIGQQISPSHSENGIIVMKGKKQVRK